MSVREIAMLGDQALRTPAVDIQTVDDDLRALIRDMFETMYDAEGIGLAGPQIRVGQRVIVVDVREDDGHPLALINPRILESSRESERAEEGCLSIPGIAGVVERAQRVVVEGLDENGEPVKIEAEGLLARCLQHEIDHLDGVLFVDRLSPLKRNMVLKKYRALQAEAPDGKPRRLPPRRTRR
jgi:peptide deformylase